MKVMQENYEPLSFKILMNISVVSNKLDQCSSIGRNLQNEACANKADTLIAWCSP